MRSSGGHACACLSCLCHSSPLVDVANTRRNDHSSVINPTFGAAQTIADVSDNYFRLETCANLRSSLSPAVFAAIGGCSTIGGQDSYLGWDSPGVGKTSLLLFIDGILYWGLLVFLEWARIRKGKISSSGSNDADEDSDVSAERDRIISHVSGQPPSDDVVSVLGMTKTFKKAKSSAVDGLTFGVAKGWPLFLC